MSSIGLARTHSLPNSAKCLQPLFEHTVLLSGVNFQHRLAMPFTFDPFPSESHMRLLKLNCRIFWNNRIRCTISSISLDSCPSYEGVSYTWGNSPPVRPYILTDSFLRYEKICGTFSYNNDRIRAIKYKQDSGLMPSALIRRICRRGTDKSAI